MTKKLLLTMLLFLVFITNIGLISFAAYDSETYMQGIEIKNAESTTLWENIAVTYSDSEIYFDSPIVNFDISNTGDIAVALNNRKIIVIENGIPVRSIGFYSSGSYYVFWHESNLCMYHVRSHMIVEFTKDCELVRLVDVVGDSDSMNIIKKLRKAKIRTYGDSTYRLKRWGNIFDILLFDDAYVSIEKIDTVTNEKEVLCSSNGSAVFLVITRILLLSTFFTVPAIILFVGLKKMT